MPQESIPFPALSPAHRLRAMLAVVVAGVIFLAVISRSLLVPDDPLGCVSAIACRLDWWIIPASAIVAFLMAGVVCLISGAKLEETGVFAVALGLSLAVARHGNAGYLWATFGQSDDQLRKGLAGLMAVEAAGWAVVVAAAYAGSVLTIKKLQLKPAITFQPDQEYRVGALTVLFMSIIAMLSLQLLSAGSELAPIQTGQVYFAVAASFYLAAFFGYQITGAGSPVWAYLTVGVVAVSGYLWTVFHPSPTFPGRLISHLAHFAPTAFGRASPVQMVMIGTAAAIFGNWHQRQLTRYAVIEDKK